MKILRAVEQQREKGKDPASFEESIGPEIRAPGQIVPLELDSTREDSLRACLDAVRAKLPAGEDGKSLLNLIWNGRVNNVLKVLPPRNYSPSYRCSS